MRAPNGAPLRFLLEVAAKYDGEDCLAWPYACDGGGRGKIWHQGKFGVVPRLVCEIVNGPPPTPNHEAAHSCGLGHAKCCSPKHLSWKTPRENSADSAVHGTMVRGERQWMSKLKRPDIPIIRSLKGVESNGVTARRYGVNAEQVRRIQNRERWAWVE